MDHLILNESSYEYREVPYLPGSLNTFVYDNGQHTKFPERMGWSWSEISEIACERPSPIPGHTAEQAAALVQAWLYFGLIHLITELPVDTSEYVRPNADGRLIVTSKPLLKHLQRWRSSLAGREDGGAEQIAQVDRLFKILQYYLSHVAVVWKDLLPHEVGASIVVLHQTLALVKLSMFPGSYSPPSLCNFHDYFHKRMRAPLIEHGWCRAVVHRLGQNLSTPTLYHMSSIKTALPCTLQEHVACSNHQCEISKPSPKSFQPQHVDSNCGCKLMPSIQDEVTTIIEKRCIPLLAFSEDAGLSTKPLSLACSDEYEAFVAISHVWADGLGNPLDNTMYHCQLALMQSRIDDVSAAHHERLGDDLKNRGCHFWIDTLCVPAKEGDAKFVAIEAMEAIYRKATIVLIIDASLKQLKSTAVSPFELAISVAASKWWTRLWTLQEGIFAQALYFQLSDTAVSPDGITKLSRDLISKRPDGALAWDMQTTLVEDALSEVQNLSISKLRSDSGRYILSKVAWRSTTRAADETICLAILLQLPVSTLHRLAQDPQTRMKAFILMQRHFPRSILFGRGNFEQHFGEEGFRWAPCSFLSRKAGPSMEETLFSSSWLDAAPRVVDSTYADERGLHVRSYGFRLDFRNCTETNTQGFSETDLANVIVCLVLSGANQGIYRLPLSRPEMLSWTTRRSSEIPMFVILSHPLEVGSRASLGVLVSKSETGTAGETAVAVAADEIVCRYERRIMVYLAERHLTREPYKQYRFASDAPGAIIAAELDVEQKWCVI